MSIDEGSGGPSVIVFDEEGRAHVHGDVLVAGDSGRDAVIELTGMEPVESRGNWWRFGGVEGVVELVEAMQSLGYMAQPNHVFFAHTCGGGCPPHPAWAFEALGDGWWANPMKANPMKANPMKANPMKANPMKANPMKANPMKANPMKANHPMESSAVPAPGRELPSRTMRGPGVAPAVVVLDTGVATPPPATAGANVADHSPALVRNAANITGALDVPDAAMPPNPADGYLDPVAGHGTFIAGLIEQLAPGCRISVEKVIGVRGDVDEWVLADAVDAAVQSANGPTILSISLGGPTLTTPTLLRQAVARAALVGIPVVASAGNDGVCTPQYPAAFPGVVAVGALGPDGPAPFTNYGPWVDACAPGTDLVSSFFDGWNGKFPRINSVDLDHFSGWAVWSGTSFAVPVVVAALCREIVSSGCSPVEAVRRVVRAPHLLRIPCLGTVVNL